MSCQGEHNRTLEVLTLILDLPIDRRDEAVTKLCATHNVPVEEVKSLLRMEIRAGELFDQRTLLSGFDEAIAGSSGQGPPAIPGCTDPVEIGEGANAVVYRAYQPALDREVAIKLLRPLRSSDKGIKRFSAEARILARMRHPALCEVFEIDVIESGVFCQPYLIMELVQGDPIDVVCRKHGLGVEDRARLLTALCDAVGYIHEMGVTHRDIKPSNILVSKNDTTGELNLKLIDFGIAKILKGRPSPFDTLTAGTSQIGTLRYMSPERRTGKSNGASTASDVYSMGIVAMEVFGVEHECRHYGRVPSLNGVHQPGLTQAPPELSRLVLANPDKRVQSAAEAREIIESTAAILDASAERGPMPTRRSRTRLLCGLALSVLTLAGAVCWFAFSGNDTPKKPSKLPYMGGVSDHVPESRMADVGHLKATAQIIERAWKAGDPTNADLPIDEQYSSMIKYATYIRRNGYAEDAIEKLELMQDTLVSQDDWTEDRLYYWSRLGAIYLAEGKHPEARRVLTDVLAYARTVEIKWSIEALVRTQLAGAHYLQHDYENALTQLHTIIETLPESPSDEELLFGLQALSSVGVIQRDLGDYDKAHATFQALSGELTPLAERYPVHANRMAINLAHLHLWRDENKQAERIARSALRFWSPQAEDYPLDTAEAELVLAEVLLERGDLLEAKHLFEQSLGHYTRRAGMEINRFVPLAENGLGACYVLLGNTQRGTDLLETSEASIRGLWGPDHPRTDRAERRRRTLSGDAGL